jgi:hypothetical protein
MTSKMIYKTKKNKTTVIKMIWVKKLILKMRTIRTPSNLAKIVVK